MSVNSGDLVVVWWRDSFSNHDENSLTDVQDDCRWFSVGFVARKTDLFLTIITGVQDTSTDGLHTVDNVLSIPWTQIIEWEVV